MKKVLFLLALLLPFKSWGQVFILNDNIFQQRMSDVKVTVLDSLTNDPVGFASVYVIPAKDTTITNFTLTDAKGEAKLDEVPFGKYLFHVEMMGYRPFIRERYFRESEVDMGTIRLQVDEQFLEAAVVSDVGNPVVVKKDTVEFNASSYRVGSNAMLKDLLKRMPGMEVTADGKVKFNGEEIDKLTVGGRTFFFNDQSTALNNLPAAVVDKIRVIDRESESSRASGLQDGSREKVLDVALKKEYEKGWFGNVGVKGGTTLGKKDGADALRDNRGFLWNANALISAYSEKDQVTVIANGQNINDSNAVVVFVNDDGDATASTDQGLSTAAQLGLNANTSRIKNVETTVGANYKYTDTDSGTRSNRTTYQEGGNLRSMQENGGKAYNQSVSANLEFQKENGKTWFHFRPYFTYNRSRSTRQSASETHRESQSLNSSESVKQSASSSRDVNVSGDITFREIGGKENRTLRLDFNGYYSGTGGESSELSVFTTDNLTDRRAMTYDSKGANYLLNGGLEYAEPLGEKWTLQASANIQWQKRDNLRDAFDAAGRNDYYSSVSNSRSLTQEYGLTAQYKFNAETWITLGAEASGIRNETFSKTYGVEKTVGEGEWNWFVTPTMRFQFTKGYDRLRVTASGYSSRPGNTRMLPVMDISDPSRLSLGNVYLKPYSMTSLYVNWSRNNPSKFTNLMVTGFADMRFNGIGQALWYDASGILYTLPVNIRKPAVTGTLYANYTLPLDAKKQWSLNLGGSATVSSSVSYQASGTLSALDKDTFNYSAFMEDFWGDAGGDRFYGGLSGFAESRTWSVSPSANFSVRYNPEMWSMTLGAYSRGYIARYSLNPKADMNTLETSFNGSVSYTTPHEFELQTDLSYVFYKGYSAGYGQPEWQWNAEISRNIGAFNVSVKVQDILNQTRSLSHVVTANYEEDTYRLIMGRYILVGLKWNFGKMNAAHSSRAQQAAWNMLF